MAQRNLNPTYLLGVPDELITASNRHLVTWRTNKLGGEADWMMPADPDAPKVHCMLCDQEQVLVVQIYAPLDGTPYHRTLYVFSCLSPGCASRSEGWHVLRSQQLEETPEIDERAANMSKTTEVDWLDMANDWGDDDGDEGLGWSPVTPAASHSSVRLHDNEGFANWEEKEMGEGSNRLPDNNSCRFLNILEGSNYSRTAFSQKETETNVPSQHTTTSDNFSQENMLDEQGNACHVFQSRSVDESLCENVCKLHLSDSMEGAVGVNYDFDAEVEPPDEGTNITLDTPSVPSQDCISALFGTESFHHKDVASQKMLSIKAMFLAVVEEPLRERKNLLNDHEKELLASYQRQEGVNINDLYRSQRQESGGGPGEEMYEKCFVKHWDRTFQKMRNRLGLCSEQLIRYSREQGAGPILMASSRKEELDPGKCQHCNGEMIFEFQIMPTVVDFMRIEGHKGNVLEFGTVVVYTCQKSCWHDGLRCREEKIIAMPDPDEALFRAMKSRGGT